MHKYYCKFGKIYSLRQFYCNGPKGCSEKLQILETNSTHYGSVLDFKTRKALILGRKATANAPNKTALLVSSPLGTSATALTTPKYSSTYSFV